MKNICPNTDIFFTNCERKLNAGIDVIRGILEKMSSKLCLHHGWLMLLMENHGDELSQTEVSSVTQFVSFAIQFADHKCSKTDHGLKHNDLFCLWCWLKNSQAARYRDLCGKFNECTTSFEGFREFTFGLCCTVFTCVCSTVNVAQKTFYIDLPSIYAAVRNEDNE